MNTSTVVVNGQAFEVPNTRIGELMAYLRRLAAVDVTEARARSNGSLSNLPAGSTLLNG